jgi:BirA family transcriptional regulator, biotin operon repressor / biotin---[acetyl-CoA-carboxylase] ligase
MSEERGPQPLERLVGAGLAHRLALVAGLRATSADAAPGTTNAATVGTLSGEALGQSLGLSRAAVHKHVVHLRDLGFAIESVGGMGYRLMEPFDDLVVAEAVLGHLDLSSAGARVGVPYHYRGTCESTNALAKQMAATGSAGVGRHVGIGAAAEGRDPGAPAGTTIVSDRQTGGRGRLGRSWMSEPGKDLTFSVILRPVLAPARTHLLSLATGVAVAEVLEERFGLEGQVALKWPNDVLLGGRKVCGMLLEGSMDADRLHWAVAGVGLNVNGRASRLPERAAPERAGEWKGRPQPVSLAEHMGRSIPRAPLLAALLTRLGEWWEALDPADLLLDGWRRRDALAGRPVEVVSGPGGGKRPAVGPGDLVVRGEAAGVGPEGQLLVREAGGRVVPVFAGDVSVRGLPTV